MKMQRVSSKAKWATVLTAAALHPVLLILLIPMIGERANLAMVLAPFAATWLFSLRLGMVFLLLNAVGTSVVFAHLDLTHAGPREGLTKTAVAVFIVGMICFGLNSLKRYLDRGRVMQAEIGEIKKIRETHRTD